MKKGLCILLVVILVALFAGGMWLEKSSDNTDVAGSGFFDADE